IDIVAERGTAMGVVEVSDRVKFQRKRAETIVEVSERVMIHRKGADSTVEVAEGVIDHGVTSNGRVVVAQAVEYHRCGANCGIGIRVGTRPDTTGQSQRCCANPGVEAGVADYKERKPTDSCVSCAAGDVKEGAAPFRRVERRIAPVRIPRYLRG